MSSPPSRETPVVVTFHLDATTITQIVATCVRTPGV